MNNVNVLGKTPWNFCNRPTVLLTHLQDRRKKKETLEQVFSCEFREISKNTFSYRAPLVAASGSVET